jgi:hypothetical protein
MVLDIQCNPFEKHITASIDFDTRLNQNMRYAAVNNSTPPDGSSRGNILMHQANLYLSSFHLPQEFGPTLTIASGRYARQMMTNENAATHFSEWQNKKAAKNVASNANAKAIQFNNELIATLQPIQSRIEQSKDPEVNSNNGIKNLIQTINDSLQTRSNEQAELQK